MPPPRERSPRRSQSCAKSQCQCTPLPTRICRVTPSSNPRKHRLRNESSGGPPLMLSHTKYLTVKVPERMAFVNITDEVEKAVQESGVREGLCLVNAMHITASVFINDNEPGLHEDYKRWLEWLAPYDPSPERYHHNRTGEDNGDAHHKRQVMARGAVVAIPAGKLDLAPGSRSSTAS